jgi:hypothetical protein
MNVLSAIGTSRRQCPGRDSASAVSVCLSTQPGRPSIRSRASAHVSTPGSLVGQAIAHAVICDVGFTDHFETIAH